MQNKQIYMSIYTSNHFFEALVSTLAAGCFSTFLGAQTFLPASLVESTFLTGSVFLVSGAFLVVSTFLTSSVFLPVSAFLILGSALVSVPFLTSLGLDLDSAAFSVPLAREAFLATLAWWAAAFLLAIHLSQTFLYSSVAARVFFHLLTLSCFWILFLLILTSVISLWILGAFCLRGASGFFAPLKVLLITFFLIKAVTLADFYPSAFEIPKSFLIPEALLGPSLLGLTSSVSPGISFSPFLTTTQESILISGPTMQPLTDFLFLSPDLLARYPLDPGFNKSLTLPLEKIPCFIAKPSPSQPPVILKTQPLNSSPNESASTS